LEAAQRAADVASTSAAAAHESMDVNDVSDYATASEDRLDEMGVDFRRSVTMEEHWKSESERFENTFVNNPFGHECDVCDRLWFLRDLKPVKSYERTKKHYLPTLVKRVDSFCGRRSSTASITEAQRLNVDDDHDNENSRRAFLLVWAMPHETDHCRVLCNASLISLMFRPRRPRSVIPVFI
jgi:hypothetical protein